MLTGDLVRVRFRKGVIQPPYIVPEEEDLLGLLGVQPRELWLGGR